MEAPESLLVDEPVSKKVNKNKFQAKSIINYKLPFHYFFYKICNI